MRLDFIKMFKNKLKNSINSDIRIDMKYIKYNK